jgi:hypothetical protein
MRNCRELATRAFVSLAAANLLLPFSLLFCCLDSRRAPAGDNGGSPENGSLAKVCKSSAHPRTGVSRVAVVQRPRGMKVRIPLHCSAIGTKHRLHLGRAAEIRMKDGCDHLSPFVNHPAASCVADTIIALETSCHVDRTGSTLERCVDISRLIL